jgi:hypothetical protein
MPNVCSPLVNGYYFTIVTRTIKINGRKSPGDAHSMIPYCSIGMRGIAGLVLACAAITPIYGIVIATFRGIDRNGNALIGRSGFPGCNESCRIKILSLKLIRTHINYTTAGVIKNSRVARQVHIILQISTGIGIGLVASHINNRTCG